VLEPDGRFSFIVRSGPTRPQRLKPNVVS
jgi:hypothetical protein